MADQENVRICRIRCTFNGCTWLGAASVWPVQLMFRDTHRPAIVHGLSPAVSVAALIPEDLSSEHDHVVIGRPEIRIPAALCQQRPGEGLSQRAGCRIVRLEFQESQTGGWAADTDADTSRRLTCVSLRPATLSSAQSSGFPRGGFP